MADNTMRQTGTEGNTGGPYSGALNSEISNSSQHHSNEQAAQIETEGNTQGPHQGALIPGTSSSSQQRSKIQIRSVKVVDTRLKLMSEALAALPGSMTKFSGSSLDIKNGIELGRAMLYKDATVHYEMQTVEKHAKDYSDMIIPQLENIIGLIQEMFLTIGFSDPQPGPQFGANDFPNLGQVIAMCKRMKAQHEVIGATVPSDLFLNLSANINSHKLRTTPNFESSKPAKQGFGFAFVKNIVSGSSADGESEPVKTIYDNYKEEFDTLIQNIRDAERAMNAVIKNVTSVLTNFIDAVSGIDGTATLNEGLVKTFCQHSSDILQSCDEFTRALPKIKSHVKQLYVK